jgi:hypothetical protein
VKRRGFDTPAPNGNAEALYWWTALGTAPGTQARQAADCLHLKLYGHARRRRRPVERGVVYYYHTVQSLMGTNIVMMGNALELSFQSGGMGGFIEQTFILEGMQDPDDPWEKDPGDLIVKVSCLPGFGLHSR